MHDGYNFKGGLSWKICILHGIEAYTYFLYQYMIFFF